MFYVNVFVILPALIVAFRALPGLPGEKRHPPFDLIGALQLLVILSGAAALMTGAAPTQSTIVTWGIAGLLVLLVAHFLRREARHDDPIFQPRFFRNVTFAAANAGVALSNLAMYTAFLAIPLLLADCPIGRVLR